MRPRDRKLGAQLDAKLLSFDSNKRALPGIRDSSKRGVLIEQILESIHRVNYVLAIRQRNVSERRADPNDELFDPLKAAILNQRKGQIEEAFWLVFLFVHFGKHSRAGWRYAREIYGRLGDGNRWDWANVSANPAAFRKWLHDHQGVLKRADVPGGFGNHRKYESLKAYSPGGTGAVIESYVDWINPPRTHQELMDEMCRKAAGDRRNAFDAIYKSMCKVTRFGRTARFDFLAMIGKLNLAPIEPGSAYIRSATGPLAGAKLLFGGKKDAVLAGLDIEEWLIELDAELKVGMQVLEDALCNWQKSPGKLERFRG